MAVRHRWGAHAHRRSISKRGPDRDGHGLDRWRSTEQTRFDLAPDGNRFIVRTVATAEQTDDEAFNGLTFGENWFAKLKARVPID